MGLGSRNKRRDQKSGRSPHPGGSQGAILGNLEEVIAEVLNEGGGRSVEVKQSASDPGPF